MESIRVSPDLEGCQPPTDPGPPSAGPESCLRVSIGILAYNEESAIATTIASIAEQSLLLQLPPRWSIELICVPNGCKDRTAQVASEAIARLVERCGNPDIAGRVEVVDRASKENAWNEFVHRISDPRSDVLVMMDGDVRLVHPDTLRNMIDSLRNHPRAYVCGARTIKHLEARPHRGVNERISLLASRLRAHAVSHAGIVAFAGCLYAARASACRRIWLPSILRGEDSFLHAIWATDFFTVPVNQRDATRIISAADATVMFEAYVKPSQVLKNLRRRAVGITINSMLYDRLWSQSTREQDAGVLLTRWHLQEPGWDQRLLAEKIKERGRWVPPGGPFLRWISPQGNLWTWFRRLKGMPLHRKLASLPIACVGTCLMLYAYIAANRLLRSGKLDNLWFTTQTKLTGTGVSHQPFKSNLTSG